MTNRFPVGVSDIAILMSQIKIQKPEKKRKKHVENNLSFKMKLIAKFRCSPFKYQIHGIICHLFARQSIRDMDTSQYKPYLQQCAERNM